MIYLAMPGLRARAWKMTPIPPHSLDDVDETHAALIRSMTVKVHTVNLDRAIVARLLGQAVYEVGKEHDEQRQATTTSTDAIEQASLIPGAPPRTRPNPATSMWCSHDWSATTRKTPSGSASRSTTRN